MEMPFKSIEEYRIMLKDLLIEKKKSLDYVMGYILCLKDHNLLHIDDALELLKFASGIYFKNMGEVHSEKDPIKNTKVTMLRMDKGN